MTRMGRKTRTRVRTGAIVLASAGLLAAGGMSSAVAAKLITGKDIANGSILQEDLAKSSVGAAQLENGEVSWSDLSGDVRDRVKNGDQGPAGPAGPTGPAGTKGLSGLEGAFYAVAYYDVGETNAGAVASVGCDPTATGFTALSGGAQMIGLPGGESTPVASSFPGRMNWDTNTPIAGRLDGWIVQLDGEVAEPPYTVKVWALCVPRTDIPVKQTYLESAD